MIPVVRADEAWTIVTGPAHAGDAAVLAAIEDLQHEGRRFGMAFAHAESAPATRGPILVVGAPDRNPLTATLVREHEIDLKPIDHPQAFALRTLEPGGGRVLLVVGGSLVGDVYGMYWVWDRLRVHRRIPELNVLRTPALPYRLTGVRGTEQIRNALRYTATWVTGADIQSLDPWDTSDKPNRSRQRAAERIELAHRYHMKVFAGGDEIAYRPEVLARYNAQLDPADPALWNMLQDKYRRLFRTIPGLDGVQIRTGELTRISGAYRPFDIMHDLPVSDWSLERRYRTFLQKLHEVVVGEFDKIYFHRTWVVNTQEQHSDPDVYKRIFTRDVPSRNLYLSPYMSLGDRWYYQPYNPTFNQTPHKMFALLSTLDYHAHGGVNVFPSFPGQYHQGGLQSILRDPNHNLVGVHFGVPGTSGWDTSSLTGYTVYRLAWNPNEPLRTIARDFAAIHLGPDVADDVAEIILLSHQAYKDGIYIKPVAEAIRGNTLPHLRLTTFRVRGIPAIDQGREHIEWLADTMYAPSRGHEDEAIAHLDRGLAAAVSMEKRFEPLAGRIDDQMLAEQVGDGLTLTRWLVETNNAYVKTCYAYFQCRDARDGASRDGLRGALDTLRKARERFIAAPGFVYRLDGIDQLMRNAAVALDDLDRAEKALATAPTGRDIDALIVRQQQQHAKILADRQNEAVKVLEWRGRVDGRDLLHVRGKTIEIEHLQSDPIADPSANFTAELPAREVTVLVKDKQSQAVHPFLLEQPTKDNDHTAKIYLFDQPPGYGRWEIDLYYLDAHPKDVGLALPWQ